MAVFSIVCDYLIFFGFLIGSTLYPLWGSLLRQKKPNEQAETKANYVFASGQVGIFAMMLSIARGTLGVRAFLGKVHYTFIFVLELKSQLIAIKIFFLKLNLHNVFQSVFIVINFCYSIFFRHWIKYVFVFHGNKTASQIQTDKRMNHDNERFCMTISH